MNDCTAKAMRGEQVRGLAGERARAALKSAGLAVADSRDEKPAQAPA